MKTEPDAESLKAAWVPLKDVLAAEQKMDNVSTNSTSEFKVRGRMHYLLMQASDAAAAKTNAPCLLPTIPKEPLREIVVRPIVLVKGQMTSQTYALLTRFGHNLRLPRVVIDQSLSVKSALNHFIKVSLFTSCHSPYPKEKL